MSGPANYLLEQVRIIEGLAIGICRVAQELHRDGVLRAGERASVEAIAMVANAARHLVQDASRREEERHA